MVVNRWSVEEETNSFWVFDPALDAAPHARLDEMRAACPVAHSDVFGGFWVLTRYQDVHRVLSDSATFSSIQVTVPHFEDPLGPQIPVNFDPPELNRYRHMFAPLFSPTVAAKLEPRTRSLARTLVEAIGARGTCDFLRDFAVPLPGQVFLEMLGVPVDDLEMLLVLKEQIIRDGLSGDPDKALYAQDVARPALARYVQQHLERRRDVTDPEADLLSGFLLAEEDGVRLSEQEIVRAVTLLMTAGLDTVTNLLALS
jgi:cytochrome P450